MEALSEHVAGKPLPHRGRVVAGAQRLGGFQKAGRGDRAGLRQALDGQDESTPELLGFH